MEPISLIFSTLCVVLYSGGEDCSYEWVVAPQDILVQEFKDLGGKIDYRDFPVKQAFTNMTDKEIWFDSSSTMVHVEHEIKHAVCSLEYEKSGVNHPYCTGHFSI